MVLLPLFHRSENPDQRMVTLSQSRQEARSTARTPGICSHRHRSPLLRCKKRGQAGESPDRESKTLPQNEATRHPRRFLMFVAIADTGGSTTLAARPPEESPQSITAASAPVFVCIAADHPINDVSTSPDFPLASKLGSLAGNQEVTMTRKRRALMLTLLFAA